VLIPSLGSAPLARKYSTTCVQPLKQAQVNVSASAFGSLAKSPPSYHLMTGQGEPSEGVSNSGARREKSPAINPRTASWKDMSLWLFIVFTVAGTHGYGLTKTKLAATGKSDLYQD